SVGPKPLTSRLLDGVTKTGAGARRLLPNRIVRKTTALSLAVLLLAALASSSSTVSASSWLPKLDPPLQQRASLSGRSQVILRAPNATALRLLAPVVQLAGGL